jgi:hypothetical protein
MLASIPDPHIGGASDIKGLHGTDFRRQILRIEKTPFESFQIRGGAGTESVASPFLEVTGIEHDHLVLIRGLIGTQVYAGATARAELRVPDVGLQLLLTFALIGIVHPNLLIHPSIFNLGLDLIIDIFIFPWGDVFY